MIRLSREQIILLHEHLIAETGGTAGLRDEGLLDAAIQASFMSFDQKDLFPSIQQEAARLCYGLIMNHPFVDGNKRIGTHAMLVFLGLNGIELIDTSPYTRVDIPGHFQRASVSGARHIVFQFAFQTYS